MDRVKITAYITPKIAERILDNPAAALNIVGAYSITDSQGANRVGGDWWMGAQKILIAYCADQARASQVKDGIIALAESGDEIIFEMGPASVYVFTAGSK